MKNRIKNNFKITLALGILAFLTLSCERDLTDEAVEARFSNNPNVFIDGFSAGLEYLPFAGSRFDAFSVDTNEKFEGTASMRFDVPNVGDPLGAFAGAIFPDFGGRDLTEYDALTFWAKATTAGTINEIGFGQDFGENKYLTTLQNLQLTTNWQKYTIPLPDPSKLTQEKGLFWYAEGPEDGNGYSFWVDEVKYEKLGTVAQPQPRIFNGEDVFQQSFIGAATSVSGLTQTFNLENGQNQTVIAAPAYFEFNSSNPGVATVSEDGNVAIIGAGTTVITATLGGVNAEGSLTLESLGEFELAPIPTRDPENVISIFSDAYTNVPVDYYNGFFNGDGQTTQGGAPPIEIGGDQIINYTELNFVGIGTFLNVPTVDATQMTHFHVDINVQESVDPGDFIRIQLINDVGGNETSGSVVFDNTVLVTNEWVSLDIPLGEFTGLGPRDQLGLIFFVSDATISNIFVDNIYYYKDVIEPSPNVDDSQATQVALPVGFESTTLTYDILGFEGADSAIIDNPDQSGINPTSRVLRTTKTQGAQFFAGTLLNLDAPIDFSSSQKFRMKVWSPKSGIPVRVRLENADNSVGFELDANTTTLNEWEELEWDFSSLNPTADLVRVVVFFEFVPDLPGDGSTYYYDDIQIID
ncbi:MAG: carbohydrate-binding protein [Flavobacteriaceae bacterium]